eukprot:scaffold686_cov342-Prasinococcus_capsulatus_cf.AAC.5
MALWSPSAASRADVAARAGRALERRAGVHGSIKRVIGHGSSPPRVTCTCSCPGPPFGQDHNTSDSRMAGPGRPFRVGGGPAALLRSVRSGRRPGGGRGGRSDTSAGRVSGRMPAGHPAQLRRF